MRYLFTVLTLAAAIAPAARAQNLHSYAPATATPLYAYPQYVQVTAAPPQAPAGAPVYVYAVPAEVAGLGCGAECGGSCGKAGWFARFRTQPACGDECGCGDACGKKKCRGGGFFSRLRGWFCFRDTGRCDKQARCLTSCSTPLYLWFLRDCAYRPSAFNCAGCGCGQGSGNVDGAVNPPYQRNVFPVGHMMGGMPTGVAGSCCR